MDTAFYLFSNLFHIYAVYMFSNIFFDKNKVGKLKELLLYLAYYAINSFAYICFGNWFFNLFTNFFLFFLITFIYKSSVLKKAAASFITNAVIMICDLIVSAVMTTFNINSMFFSKGFVSGILFIAAIQLTDRFFSFKNDVYVNFSAAYYTATLFVPMGSIMIGCFLAKDLNLMSLISSIVLLLINMDFNYLFDSVIKMFSEKHEKELIAKQNQAYKNQLNLTLRSQTAIRCIKHDMENHILRMQYLLSKGKYEELKEYLSQTKNYIDFNSNIIESGNESIDSVLNYKLAKLKDMDVETKYDFVISKDLSISSFDMNIVIGNLIDNALEALERMEEDSKRKLSVSIRSRAGYVKIIIGNSFDGVIPGKGKTRKSDKINHGIGLKSVENIVEKYGGLLDTRIKDNWFEVCAILYEA